MDSPNTLWWFDGSYYSKICQVDFSDNSVALNHYLSVGRLNASSPNGYFNAEWYEWQNPDCLNNFLCAFDHYLDCGLNEGRDPSPLVDLRRFANFHNGLSYFECYKKIVGGCGDKIVGVYNDWEEMKYFQDIFYNSISVYAHKINPFRESRKFLVYLQAGSSSLHKEWFNYHDSERKWDLLANCYESVEYDQSFGDYVVFQSGTKTTGMYLNWMKFDDILSKYEYVLFLDDDILVEHEQLNKVFECCVENKLDLAQMSLSDDSYCTWDVFYSKGKGVRYVSGVEIMMPIMSKHALNIFGEYLRLSVSGFGIDLLMGKIIQNKALNNIAVLDDYVAKHRKPIDESNGGLYSYLRSRSINPKSELWCLIQRYGLSFGFSEINKEL